MQMGDNFLEHRHLSTRNVLAIRQQLRGALAQWSLRRWVCALRWCSAFLKLNGIDKRRTKRAAQRQRCWHRQPEMVHFLCVSFFEYRKCCRIYFFTQSSAFRTLARKPMRKKSLFAIIMPQHTKRIAMWWIWWGVEWMGWGWKVARDDPKCAEFQREDFVRVHTGNTSHHPCAVMMLNDAEFIYIYI